MESKIVYHYNRGWAIVFYDNINQEFSYFSEDNDIIYFNTKEEAEIKLI